MTRLATALADTEPVRPKGDPADRLGEPQRVRARVLGWTQPAIRPDPPTNFQPNWPIDTERHTALHWAAAMGDIDVIKQLKAKIG